MAPVFPQFTSITDLQDAIQDGRATVKEVVQQYLQQIDRLNGELNAVTAVNLKAIEEAEKLDVSKQPLRSYGIPAFHNTFLIDIIGTPQRTKRPPPRPSNPDQRPNRNRRNRHHIRK